MANLLKMTSNRNTTGYVSNKLLRDLLWAASEGKDASYELTGKDARRLLEGLGIEWVPTVEKETRRPEAVRSFKKGLKAKFGTKNVSFLEDKIVEDGREYDRLTVTVLEWVAFPDEAIEHLAAASGLSRHFEVGDTGWCLPGRDLEFVSRRGRKID